jgi:hypothetical protein
VRRVATMLVLVGCCLGLAQAAAANPPSYADNPNPVLFPKQSHPYGADMTTWSERAAAWIVGQPFAHNPLFDQTGADCGNGQQGPVWFIPPIAGPHVFSGSRACTIPAGKAILLDIGHDLNDYPCPAAFGFEPAPGESLYDFLIRTDLPIMDSVNLLDVSLDGQPFSDVLSYRFISPSLFYFNGDSSMQDLRPLHHRRAAAGDRRRLLHDGQAARPGPAHDRRARHEHLRRRQDLRLPPDDRLIPPSDRPAQRGTARSPGTTSPGLRAF